MVKSGYKITIKTLNQEDFFNNLQKQDIECYNIKRESKLLTTFNLQQKNINVVKDVLDKRGASIVGIEAVGLKKTLKWLFSRIFIFVAIGLFFIASFISNVFILKIDIRGLSCLNSMQIINLLKQNGVCLFSSKSLVDTQKLQLNLKQSFDEISMVSVMIKGTSLVINIKEKTKEELELLNTKDIISDFNGRIIDITLVSGVTNIKQGDIVKLGDVLVKSVKDENNFVPAIAKITAEIWLEGKYTHSCEKINKIRTGKIIKQREVSLCGIHLFSNAQECKFELFDKEVSSNKLNNVLLPLKIQQTTYYELKEENIYEDFKDVKQQIINVCKQNALQQKQENDILKLENCSISELGLQTFVNYVVTVERTIFYNNEQ